MGVPGKPNYDIRAGVSGSQSAAALVERIAASRQFAKSPRLQELFRYLCHSALDKPQAVITEHQIGVAIFGWDRDHDSGSDTIVRVQVSQLRKKLEHYFLSEGQQEPIAVRIPRGSYVPVFETREEAAAEGIRAAGQPDSTARPAVSEPLHRRRRLWIAAAGAGAAALAAFCVFLLVQRPEAAPAREPTPALDQFWSPFRGGRPAQIVVSDANLIVLSEILGRTISLQEYRYQTYPQRILDNSIPDAQLHRLANNVLMTHTTGMQDANVLASLTLLLSRYQTPATAISARDFRMPQPDNLILLGHPKGNPWVRLFDDRLNFHYQFDWKNRKGVIVNGSPAQGEAPSYTANFGNEGYCVVACLPKPIGPGAALLIFGSDMSSLEAGGRFVSDEVSIDRLYRRLGVRPKSAPPYVEILLHTRLLQNLAPGFEIIAHRIPTV